MKGFLGAALLLLVLPVFAQSPEPVSGKDYIEISNGRPLDLRFSRASSVLLRGA